MTKQLPLHPLALIFPDITGNDFDGLVESIKKDGLLDPIYEYNSEVIDGKNRQRACAAAGVTPVYAVWAPPKGCTDKDEISAKMREFVVAKNDKRRHMADSVRAMTAAKLAIMSRVSIEKAATELHVSPRYAQMASVVLEKGDRSLVNGVTSGAINVSDASKIVDLPKQEQKKAVDDVKSGKAKKVSIAAGVKPRKKQPKIQPNFDDGPDLEAQKVSGVSCGVESSVVPTQVVSVQTEVQASDNASKNSVSGRMKEDSVPVPTNGSFSQIQQQNWRTAFGTIVRMGDEWSKQHSKTKVKTERTHKEFHAITHALLKKWMEMNPAGRWS